MCKQPSLIFCSDPIFWVRADLYKENMVRIISTHHWQITRSTIVLFCVYLSLFIFSVPTIAADTDDELIDLAKKLVELRSEVEGLSNELDRKKTEFRDNVKTLISQKSELEIQIKNEELKLKQIQQAIAKVNERIKTEKVDKTYLLPLVNEQSQRLKSYIEQALPFKVSERITEIEHIEEQLQRDEIESEKSLAQLWAILEDEFRHSSESGLYRQPIVLDGEEQIADIARLGMVLMYFKTNSDQVGLVSKKDGNWRFQVVTPKENRNQILYLFDSLKKRIREGYYELPNAM